MQSRPFVSFLIPAYNEEFGIQGVFQDLYKELARHPEWTYEVIVIEDGSRDSTRHVVSELVQRHPHAKAIFHDVNRGYTRSIKDGISQAQGEFLMYIGADEEFDCSELAAFLEPLGRGGTSRPDVVLGVRWQRNAYKLFRYFLSIIYIFLLNYMFKLRINDYNWSQVWRRELLERIEVHAKSLFILPEIIVKAHDLGYAIKEVPSNHRGRKRGKSSLNIRIMFHALWDAIGFKIHRDSEPYSPMSKAGTDLARYAQHASPVTEPHRS